MRKIVVAAGLVALLGFMACGSAKKLRPSQAPDINILKSSENIRTYQSDYDTTFRAALDALRHIDNSSAKYVKHSEGIITFKKPDDSGTTTANVKRIDEKTTCVELSAKNRRKYWIDGGDKKTRDAFFAELDQLLGRAMPEEGDTDGDEEEPAAERRLSKKEAPDKGPLLDKLRQMMQLGNEDFLDKLSYEELSSLDRTLQSYGSVSTENKKLTRRCYACYIDLARLYQTTPNTAARRTRSR